jgi:hypothetical protein
MCRGLNFTHDSIKLSIELKERGFFFKVAGHMLALLGHMPAFIICFVGTAFGHPCPSNSLLSKT